MDNMTTVNLPWFFDSSFSDKLAGSVRWISFLHFLGWVPDDGNIARYWERFWHPPSDYHVHRSHASLPINRGLPGSVKALEYLELPMLQTVRIADEGYAFLLKHGHKIRDFKSRPRYHSPTSGRSIFELCPRIDSLTVADSPNRRPSMFGCAQPHIVSIATIWFLQMDAKKLYGFLLVLNSWLCHVFPKFKRIPSYGQIQSVM